MKYLKKIYKWLPFFILFIPFKFLSLLSTKKNILLFGTGTGMYHDNSKYLFEYFFENRDNYSDYEAYWVAKSDDVYQLLKQQSLPVVKYNSLELTYLASKSKAYFITAEIFDIFWFIGSFTKLIQLWHGIPIKSIGYDYCDDLKNIKFKSKYFTKNYSYDRFDFFIIEDPIYKFIFESAFQIDSSKFKSYGQPRNEYLQKFNKNIVKNNISEGVLNKFDKVILYAPTFRKNINENKLVINQILCNKNLMYLEKNNYCLIVKVHPFLISLNLLDKVNSSHIIDCSLYQDIQNLLAISDAVVTDISSLALDYLTFSTNLYTFFPDELQYLEDRNSFYEISYKQLKENSISIKYLNEINFENTFKIYNKKPCKNILEVFND